MTTKLRINYLKKIGYIYKELKGDWYLVRLYANPEKLGYNIIFPLRLKYKGEN